MGAWRIASLGVLTRRASAIEAMGAVTVLCTDKTGTLTQNRMTVTELWLADGRVASAIADAVAPAFRALLEASALASAPIPVDPMETAFHAAARAALVPARNAMVLVHTHGLRPAVPARRQRQCRARGSGAQHGRAKHARARCGHGARR